MLPREEAVQGTLYAAAVAEERAFAVAEEAAGGSDEIDALLAFLDGTETDEALKESAEPAFTVETGSLRLGFYSAGGKLRYLDPVSGELCETSRTEAEIRGFLQN